MKLKTHNGFTLTETMVAVLLFAFIVAGLNTMFSVSNSFGLRHNARVTTQQQARNTIDTLGRDLRVAQGLVISQDTNNVTMIFSRPGVGNVYYTWTTSPGSDANRLIRTTDTGTRIIARDIAALVLTNAANDVTIDVTTSVKLRTEHADDDDMTFQLVSKIAKR